ncbi:SAM-dependent methyltransferase [Mangrovihabitans endophyticus]|uniref:Cyclopropane-fatty-acyl-phospholipid synthase n=1 Tax=Mangrovihabitans endophyticus TaxID=1751298 RepID=A0A8J3FN02_9ACTN|nr:cyclopropane-fatty-acyl-phospholipid synthase family protein [Mangrovihabitans endophyticus]GGK80188.1 cyclopropane-fatty-acyl-phospholipid synthase [Mangrovihabitans endophyticus]
MTDVLVPAAGIDPQRWPGVAATPVYGMRGRIAAALFRRAAASLPLRVAYPDGTVTGERGPVMRLHRPEAFAARLGDAGLIGFGEAYQAGDWDCDDLVALLTVFAGRMATLIPPRLQWLRRFHGLRAPRSERNTPHGSRRNIQRHYDLSNDLFALFLDDSMTYSSALFDDPAEDLTVAQHRKIDRLLDGARVRAGSRVLEIGTGWGELAIRAARRGADVVSVTLSTEQRDLARRRAEQAGVADRIEVRLCDYREIEPVTLGFDAIVSVEMIEAVGEAYWPVYADVLHRHLAPDGRVALQMITMAHDRMLATRDSYTWIHKYVFPGGLIPSVPAVQAVAARAGLTVTGRHDFGADYARTLHRWRAAFQERRDQVTALGFDATFLRTWNFYLAYCEAGFAAGYLDVCQLTMGRTR